MKAYERLLSYVKVFTPSSEETGTSPSTQYQFDLARLLVQELKELGVKDADVDEHCYVYGHIPATRGYESRQKLGFIAGLRHLREIKITINRRNAGFFMSNFIYFYVVRSCILSLYVI